MILYEVHRFFFSKYQEMKDHMSGGVRLVDRLTLSCEEQKTVGENRDEMPSLGCKSINLV